MKSKTLGMQIAAITIALTASAVPAAAQKPVLFAFHTGPSGGCPGLDWHITVQGEKLDGFVAWDAMKHMARLDGMLIPATAGKARSFKMDAQEVGGSGRKATVQGTASGEYITAEISGSGTACDDKMLQIPRVTGGTSGGGG